MPRFLIPAAIVLVSLTLYALFEVLLTDRRRVRSMPKLVWVLVVLLLPLVGPLLWLFLGREQKRAAARPVPRPSAPDDDEEFLRQLRTRRRLQEREAELDRRAAELDAAEFEARDGDPSDEGRPTERDGDADGGEDSGPAGDGPDETPSR